MKTATKNSFTEKEKGLLMTWVTVCHILAIITVSFIFYAERHPNSEIHKTVTGLGFHLKQ